MKLMMAVDFFDDMIPLAWDRHRLRRFMRMNADMGVARICWIYHGNWEDGFWPGTGMPWQANYAQTFEALGNPVLAAAVAEAHRAGMELFAVYKPFDLAIQGFPTRDATGSARQAVVGGRLTPAFNFAVEHREALMRRRRLATLPAQRIILRVDEPMASGHRFQLWRSPDNTTYQPVGGEVFPDADGVSAAFDLTSLDARFFAIQSLADRPVGHRLDTLIEVQSADGRAVPCTLGLVPRRYYATDMCFHLAHAFDGGGGFSREGFFFDYLPGIPSAVGTGERCRALRFSLSDNGQNVIGVALDVNDCVPGAPEPAEPLAVAYWLGMIQKALDCGVDGVDIRITNHNSILDWTEYGFNPPVVDAYKRRYGVDPRVEPFNREQMRRLRGEFYTAFLEQAAARVKGAGRKFALHVPDTAYGSPSASTMMEIHWDWREWIARDLPDEITLKLIDADAIRDPETAELIARCRSKAIPVSACPFVHGLADPVRYLADIASLGITAFTAYEAASLWQAKPAGFTELTAPTIQALRTAAGK